MTVSCMSINAWLQALGFVVLLLAAIGGGINVGTSGLSKFTPKRSCVVGAIGLLFAVLGSLKAVPDIGTCVPLPWLKDDTVIAPPAPAARLAWPENDWIAALEIKPGDGIPKPRPMPFHWAKNDNGLLLTYTATVGGHVWRVDEQVVSGRITRATFLSQVADSWTYRRNQAIVGVSGEEVALECRGTGLANFKARLAGEFGDPLNGTIDESSKRLDLDGVGMCGVSRSCKGTTTKTSDRTIFKVNTQWQLEFRAEHIHTDTSMIDDADDDAGSIRDTCDWSLYFDPA